MASIRAIIPRPFRVQTCPECSSSQDIQFEYRDYGWILACKCMTCKHEWEMEEKWPNA